MSKRIDPPPPTPPRHAQERVEGGEITVHDFAISVRASASLSRAFAISPRNAPEFCY